MLSMARNSNNPTTSSSKSLKEELPTHFLFLQGNFLHAQGNLFHAKKEYEQAMQSYKQAVEHYQKAADSGHARAKCTLGVFYDRGVCSFTRNEEEAKKHFDEAKGLHQASRELYKKGMQHFDDEELSEHLDCIMQAANQGFDKAIYALGKHYDNSVNVTENRIVKAKQCFQLAAALKYPEALNALGGEMLRKRDEVNAVNAVKLFTAATKQGSMQGVFRLGLCHYNGFGIPQNVEEALQCFQLAAKSNHPHALYMLCYFYAYGIGGIQNLQESLKCWNRISPQDWMKLCLSNQESVPHQLVELGLLFYREGFREGALFCIASAELGYAKGLYHAGRASLWVNHIPQERQIAREWLTQADTFPNWIPDNIIPEIKNALGVVRLLEAGKSHTIVAAPPTIHRAPVPGRQEFKAKRRLGKHDPRTFGSSTAAGAAAASDEPVTTLTRENKL